MNVSLFIFVALAVFITLLLRKKRHNPNKRFKSTPQPKSFSRNHQNRKKKKAKLSVIKIPQIGLTVKNYTPTDLKTSLDEFIQLLLDEINFPLEGVLVSGITGLPSKNNHKCFRKMEEREPINFPNKKHYFIRLRFNYNINDPWDLDTLFPENLWVDGYDQKIANELVSEADKRIEKTFEKVLSKTNSRVGVSYSRGKEQYISFGVELPVKAYDLITHCPNNLTDFGVANSNNISDIFEGLISKHNINLLSLYDDRAKLNDLCRQSENLFRIQQGIKKVGEGWVSQDNLFNLIKSHFPKAKREYSPSWLGMQRIDIYIPGKRIALEYHGLQHYEPVEHFGGEEGFRKVQARDKLKFELCKKNKVTFYEWPYTRPINEHEVLAFLKEISSN